MDKKWHVHGDHYTYDYPSEVLEELPVGIYKLEFSMFGFYLKKLGNKFKFPYKIYGTEKRLVSRVVRAFDNSDKNVGVVLNGVKGTGKTVTAKQICNGINVPVIVIDKKFSGNDNEGSSPNSFLSGIKQDFAIFVDEYEKLYNESHELLTIMDGVLNSAHKRLFVLTTNDLYINSNMLERPSRIRYLKTFNHLEPDLVQEIVDDLLVHKRHRADTILFISTLKTITIDIVKAIIEEVNIFDEAPQDFQDIFNVKKISGKFNIYCADPKDKYNKLLLKESAKVYPSNITEGNLEGSFTINDVYLGDIVEIVEKSSYNDGVTFKLSFKYDEDEDEEEVVITEKMTAKEKKEWQSYLEEKEKKLVSRIKNVVNELNGTQLIMDYVTDCMKRQATIVIYMEPAASSHDNYKYNTKYWESNF